MDKPSFAKHLVYKKDAEGQTMQVGEIVFNGKILQHAPIFPSLDNVLKDLPDFPLKKDDVWVLDYAKSGTHWIMGIAELLIFKKMKSAARGDCHVMLEIASDLKQFEKLCSPRIINSHMNLDLLPKRLWQNNKVIAMVRNPKSVAVSFFHHMRDLTYSYDGTFSGFLPMFLEGIDFYGNWFDYVIETWEAFKDRPNVLFVFYEELKKEPVKIITEVSEFLGLKHDASYIEYVAEETSIDNMTKTQLDMGGDITKPFFRKGTITDWKSHFTLAQNEMFDALYEEKMKNYPELKKRIQFS